MTQKVRFYYADVSGLYLKKKKEIKSFVSYIFQNENKVLDHLDYVFCSDEYLLDVNRSFLQHDYYTDILTFDLSENDSVIGEIYISIDRVKENSQVQNTGYSNEMLRVIFHGALHLCGYKDKKKSEITVMREREDYYLLSFAKQYL